jgi:hypothetical protein
MSIIPQGEGFVKGCRAGSFAKYLKIFCSKPHIYGQKILQN